ncbi:MAG: cytochrome c peroxidase [Arenicellales bacterium]|jgi:cytochrome c peroxidase|nr:cytochrome c peroxidase [Arenicellales bacterium]MDP7219127.1 cytochrome c peroxidase [Arenicellales bacterium]|tara:strand:- start:72 stop:1325 length:1254 start_codon:yes stop_codon:yes gene_type:complete
MKLKLSMPSPLVFSLVAVVLLVCTNAMADRDPILSKIDPDADPPLAPLPPPPAPPDNPITQAKAELGMKLFFDPKMTGDASLSCGDCHDPKQGWGFSDPISRGYPGTVHWRNSQTVVNTAYLGKLFWQGNANSLEAQAPIANKGAVAGNGEDDVMEARLRQTPYYIQKFREIFGTELPNIGDAWMAIATFERTLNQRDTPLDRYLAGDKQALSEAALKGKELFEGKANCIECHNGPTLTDEKYYNLGVPRPLEWEEMGINTVTFRWEAYAKGVHEKYYRNWKDDAGLYYSTKRRTDVGKHRTAPLRYLAYTAPYMHAGQFYTLEEVIDFYDEGGGDNEFTDGTHGLENKTPILKPLKLNDDEKESLVIFLEEISGDEIRLKLPEVPPYGVMPDVPGLTQVRAKRIGLESYLARVAQQ